ncbi:phospholipase A2 isozymes PA3A/PA3B/PA5-like [Haliotis rubra]|uniref:phospholipase A2 isozymes PA3A/PA3B/PA5-like n=1 Tax=Haliotis rubra TaxID=36100 RepID=UPI001EE4F024|nr:phospholipase A2 isozymes PA3A/PA3B/PA5-like [Haliotis rubra]
MRKMLRQSDQDNVEQVRITKQRIKLHMGYPGTQSCMTTSTQTNRTISRAARSADRCCKTLHSCKDVMPATSSHSETFNYYPWPVYGCSCTDAFNSCLKKAKTPVAREVGNLFFNVFGARCFRVEEKRECETWDAWYTKCTNYHFTRHAHLKSTKSFEDTGN